MTRDAKERAHKWLAHAGLSGLADQPARTLSGGEQQRLAVARALSLEPEVLFLDEPTASLDPASTLDIEDLIQAAAASGTKIVLVTHDIGQARRIADEIVFLYRGRIEAFEPPSHFVDVQLRGPYRLWRHRHEFEDHDGGTRMRDVVEYELRGGPLGRVAHALFARQALRRIFDFRAARIAELVLYNAPTECSPGLGAGD